ncbi:conserved hypothetical protein [Uncinocarpus reesii 1704]|uniref:Amidohydrolase-related domain-containing protein n=1 Tax=Uncinocarpus reesii (strain UAMH 1704) TaxID=336963 RepID=C4JEK4_UNCRE|nr:uncharacterized protein UREG_00843 [Uncinocarpus reesii 1704]EEP75996.1 conserved hypothetical protein [Uncinocarpus reesii 1704]
MFGKIISKIRSKTMTITTRIEEYPVPGNYTVEDQKIYHEYPRNIAAINAIKFENTLRPRPYEIAGTNPESKILFVDVDVLDSTGRQPYKGDVLIHGERIVAVGEVPDKESLIRNPDVQIFQGRGRTLMSGLGDAHTHLSWNGGDLNKLGELGVEEHTLLTARSAKCYLDSGYTITRCWGAASAKDRLDVVIRDAINAGEIPGPRCLANGREIARRDGELVAGITAFADGPDEMRQVIRSHVGIGVDQIKLSMSGEEVAGAASRSSLLADANRVLVRSRRSDQRKTAISPTKKPLRMDLLERKKAKHVVVPAINWLIATLYEAGSFGYPKEKAEQVGYKRELDEAVKALREMHERGIVVLPGGDYGFAWTPHGTYARDLEHFQNLLGFTAHESIIAATAGVAKLFMRESELGKILPGYYADCILVDGNPLEDISILQDHDRLSVIVINGRVHKAGVQEYVGAGSSRSPKTGLQKSK